MDMKVTESLGRRGAVVSDAEIEAMLDVSWQDFVKAEALTFAFVALVTSGFVWISALSWGQTYVGMVTVLLPYLILQVWTIWKFLVTGRLVAAEKLDAAFAALKLREEAAMRTGVGYLPGKAGVEGRQIVADYYAMLRLLPAIERRLVPKIRLWTPDTLWAWLWTGYNLKVVKGWLVDFRALHARADALLRQVSD